MSETQLDDPAKIDETIMMDVEESVSDKRETTMEKVRENLETRECPVVKESLVEEPCQETLVDSTENIESVPAPSMPEKDDVTSMMEDVVVDIVMEAMKEIDDVLN